MKKLFVIVIASIFLFGSCNKDEDTNVLPVIKSNNGVFILNEGNFNQLNGTLSYFDTDSNIIHNNVFKNANNDNSLGDIVQSMVIKDSLGFIVINNSSKIEVININNFKTVNTITGFNSPRHISIIDDNKAYVSDMYGADIYIINIQNYTIMGNINMGKPTERMVKYENKVFACNWTNFAMPNVNNNTVQIINTINDSLVDSIVVTKEPNSIVLDKNNNLWVLCSGGYMNDELPALYKINPENNTIIKKYDFPSINTSPSKLEINGSGDTLLFFNSGIYKMQIDEDNLPLNNFIANDGKMFYGLGIDPQNSILYVSDAVDYTQQGYVFRYQLNGSAIDSFKVGIIPGYFCFKK